MHKVRERRGEVQSGHRCREGSAARKVPSMQKQGIY
jgi:hypothetical protein